MFNQTKNLHSFLKKLKPYLSSIIIIIILLSSFIYLLSVSWLKWGHLFNDTPHELSFPQQILDGRILYKDLFHPHGLLSPYFIALLYKFFGVKILTLVWLGIAITTTLSFVLYKISRLFLGRPSAALVAITFLYLFAFGFYMPSSGIFNFILPYSFSSTFFVLFTSCALYFFLKFIFSDKKKNLILWSLFLSFAFLSRPTLALLVWLGFLIAGIIHLLKNKSYKNCWYYFSAPLILGIGTYALFAIFFDAFAGIKESLLMSTIYILGGSSALSADSGLVQNSGSSTKLFFENLVTILKEKGSIIFFSFFAHITIISLAAIGCQGISCFFAGKKKRLISIFMLFAGSILIAALFVSLYYFLKTRFPLTASETFQKIRTYPQFMCLNLIFLVTIPILFVKSIISKDKNNIVLLTLFLVAFLPTLRTPLHAHPHGAGFYLYVLAIISYYVFFFKFVSAFFKKYLRNISKLLFSSILICLFLLPVGYLWQFSKEAYSMRTAPIKTDYGTFFYNDIPDRLKFLSTIDYLKKNTSENDTVVTYPDALSINFFSSRKNPTRYYILDDAAYSEDTIISHLADSKIDYFVVIIKKPSIVKRKVFAWILQNYYPIKTIGPLENLPPIIGIFKKK